jgi:serine/threonine protein kinase/tetratricopeptide (TPR) repeat protein
VKHSVSIESTDQTLAELIDRLTERLRAGESCDLEAIVAQHVQYADRLRALWPALHALAEIGERHDSFAQSLSGGTGNSHPDADELRMGTLGDFRLLREVGRGGMGIVYEAEQISLCRRVALKILPLAGMLDERALMRFRNEAQAAAGLHHPNIVPIHGIGCERGIHYLAMQYIDGVALDRFIASVRATDSAGRSRDALASTTPLEPADLGSTPETTEADARSHQPDRPTADATIAETIDSTERSTNPAGYFRRVAMLMAQAAEALHYAHEQGIIHRDIKPANLIVDRRGAIWVADFGLARIDGGNDFTLTGGLLGTLRYMSPEQASGRRLGVDHRTDIYSLGATLYELLTLQPAVTGSSREQVLQELFNAEPVALSRLDRRIPKDIATVTLKAISKDPTDRYESAAEFAADLRRFLEDRPIQASRPTLRKRFVKWASRNASLVAVAAAASFLIACTTSAAAVVALKHRHDAQQSLLAVKTAQGEAARSWRHGITLINDVAEILESNGSSEEAKLDRARNTLHDYVAALSNERSDDPDLAWEFARAQLLALPRVAGTGPDRQALERRRDSEFAAVWDDILRLSYQGALNTKQSEFAGSVVLYRNIRLFSQVSRGEMDPAEAFVECEALLADVHAILERHPAQRIWHIVEADLRWNRAQAIERNGAQEDAKIERGAAFAALQRAGDFSPTSPSAVSLQIRLVGSFADDLYRQGRPKEAESQYLRQYRLSSEAPKPVPRQRIRSTPAWLIAASKLCQLYMKDGRAEEAQSLTMDCAAELENDKPSAPVTRPLSGPPGLSLSIVTPSSETWAPDAYFLCAQMCDSVKLTDKSAQLRKLAYEISRSNFSESLFHAFASQDPKPWAVASMAVAELESTGAADEIRTFALQTWWSALAYRSFTRYQGNDITRPSLRRGNDVTWLTDPMTPTTVDALFWLHVTKGNDSPFSRTVESPEVRRGQLIEYPALGLLQELFTTDSNASIQNDLAWKLVTWPDETLRDPTLARELARAALNRNPSDGGVLNTLGVAEYRCGNYADALKTLTESNRLNEERQPVDHYFLAMTHAQLGHSEEARQHWDRAENLAKSQLNLTQLERLVATPAVAAEEELRRFQEEAKRLLAEKLPPATTESP